STLRPSARDGAPAGPAGDDGTSGTGGEGRRLALFTAYFSCLGLGFILIEVGLIERLMILLGSPTRTVAAILFAMLLGGAAGSAWSQRAGAGAVLGIGLAACLTAAAAAALVGLSIPSFADAL